MGAEEERRGKRGGERTEEEEASMDLNHMARRNSTVHQETVTTCLLA